MTGEPMRPRAALLRHHRIMSLDNREKMDVTFLFYLNEFRTLSKPMQLATSFWKKLFLTRRERYCARANRLTVSMTHRPPRRVETWTITPAVYYNRDLIKTDHPDAFNLTDGFCNIPKVFWE